MKQSYTFWFKALQEVGKKKAIFTMVVFDLQKELHIQGDMLKRQLKRTLNHTNFLGVIVFKKFQGSKENK